MNSSHKVATFSVVGVLLFALVGTSAYFGLNNIVDDNPNVNNLSGEERVEAEQARQASFDLIDEDAIMVSHVNTEALTDEALNEWWGWYKKMLPPEFMNVDDLDGLDGLDSITLAVSPTENDDYAAGYPLYYNVIFTTDEENESELIDGLQEKNQGSTNSYLNFYNQGNGKSVVSLTSVQGLEDAQNIVESDEGSFVPNDDWFPVDAEPTMYVNASNYLGTMLNANAGDEGFSETSRAVMESAFGFTDESNFTWLGRSSDFGHTWVSDSVSDIEAIDTGAVSHEALQQMESNAIEQIMEDSVLYEEDSGNVENAFGATDNLGFLSVLEAISVRTSDGEVIGGALDPYSPEGERTEAPPVESDNGFSVVLSPIMWQSAFQGTIAPSHVKNVVAEVDADGNSSLEFNFYQEGDQGYVE